MPACRSTAWPLPRKRATRSIRRSTPPSRPTSPARRAPWPSRSPISRPVRSARASGRCACMRALRMYAAQSGDATLWGQEFGNNLNQDASTDTVGYRDTGFGFTLGLDGGNPSDGRYGGALTFYSGDVDEKTPRESKTNSEWAMLTGYTDWRGRGFFLDTQITGGYGHLDGKRYLSVGGVSRVAEGKRNTLLAAGGLTTGVILTSGRTVFTPLISVDGLTMREDGYSEGGGGAKNGGGDGFDLKVSPAYFHSVRGFAGADLR